MFAKKLKKLKTLKTTKPAFCQDNKICKQSAVISKFISELGFFLFHIKPSIQIQQFTLTLLVIIEHEIIFV